MIRPFQPEDLPAIVRIWNECVKAGETLLYPVTDDSFLRLFCEKPWCAPENLLIAERDGRPLGFIHGVAPMSFPGARPGDAYLSQIMVDRAFRRQGIGQALLNALAARMKALGAGRLLISSLNPVNLSWRIPGSPGHDHNNMPGADMECPGFGFLTESGFSVLYREVAMYIDLSGYRPPEGLDELRDTLRRQGIETGPYDAALHCGYDRMCDRVGSEYWRDVLRTEIDAWKKGRPNEDERFWPDGRKPASPRLLLTAVHDGQIVGFTGPVDLQKSGRGWFTGICTDPEFGRRGIATVLFNGLLDAFVREGAAFTSLFTGEDNPAKKIYSGAGMREARRFALMALPLGGSHE